ncbi:MAG: VWA domain-containing protein [Oligoflexia bacterium]|nr:VWA domain-containing protein [Oligoflexia bacterium]
MILKYPYLLFLIPVLIWIVYKSSLLSKGSVLLFPVRQRALKSVGKEGFLKKLIPKILTFLWLSFFVIALARPQTASSISRRISEGIDIVLTLDVSLSMTIEDTDSEDENRLALAKRILLKFVEGRADDRIGFVMFSGEAISLAPPTLDYAVVQQMISQADVQLLKDGTAIGEALATSVNRLKNSRAKSKVIILITDGDNNQGVIAPLTAGDLAAGYGIKVYAIALGKDGVVKYPDEEVDFFGFRKKIYRTTNSSINPELLKKIASTTNGKFFRAEDANALENVFKEINQLERNKIDSQDRILWSEHYQIFLIIGLTLLVLDLILRKTIFKVLPE